MGGVVAVVVRGDIEVVPNVFERGGDVYEDDGSDGDSIQVADEYGKHNKHPFKGQPVVWLGLTSSMTVASVLLSDTSLFYEQGLFV